jgi:hypothetical protein
MKTEETNVSAAHKEAAKSHSACADLHLKAADQYDHHKDADAKASSNSAMACCETATKQSVSACAASDK